MTLEIRVRVPTMDPKVKFIQCRHAALGCDLAVYLDNSSANGLAAERVAKTVHQHGINDANPSRSAEKH